jgi:hypothetical protein
MNQTISHADDLIPGNIGISPSDIHGDLSSCLANNLQASDDGVNRLFVCDETISGHTLNERAHIRN